MECSKPDCFWQYIIELSTINHLRKSAVLQKLIEVEHNQQHMLHAVPEVCNFPFNKKQNAK